MTVKVAGGDISGDRRFWSKYKEGDTIEGFYTGKSNTQYGEVYNLKTKLGNTWSINTTKDISEKFAEIPIGAYCWVTFKESIKTKRGGIFKKFEVRYDDEIKEEETDSE